MVTLHSVWTIYTFLLILYNAFMIFATMVSCASLKLHSKYASHKSYSCWSWHSSCFERHWIHHLSNNHYHILLKTLQQNKVYHSQYNRTVLLCTQTHTTSFFETQKQLLKWLTLIQHQTVNRRKSAWSRYCNLTIKKVMLLTVPFPLWQHLHFTQQSSRVALI